MYILKDLIDNNLGIFESLEDIELYLDLYHHGMDHKMFIIEESKLITFEMLKPHPKHGFNKLSDAEFKLCPKDYIFFSKYELPSLS